MQTATFEHFCDDLRAAKLAGVPLEVGTHASATAAVPVSEKRLAAAFKTLQPYWTSLHAHGEHPQPSESSAELKSVPIRLRAAAEVFAATDSMVPVLRGLSTRVVASRAVVRSLHWPVVYLIVLLAVALLGVIFFMTQLAPEINSVRADLELSEPLSPIELRDRLSWINAMPIVFGTGLALALTAILLGGVSRFAMILGGREVVRSRIMAAALQIYRDLRVSGFDPQDAIRISCELTAANAKTVQELSSFTDANSRLTEIDLASEQLIVAGDRRLARIKSTIPACMVLVVGGGAALLYGVSVFAPIVQLLQDLALPRT